MAVTLKDISEKTGVTPTVVSHVLNDRLGHIRVSKAKCALIKEVANQLGYVPNLKAKSMITRKSYTIGVICSYPFEHKDSFEHSLVDSYFYDTLRGVEEISRQVHYHCLYTVCNLSDLDEFIHPRAMRDGSIDGAVLVGYTSPEVLDKLASYNMPCIQVGSNIDPESNIECIYADLDAAFKKVAHHLAKIGHHRIQLILPAGPGPKVLADNFLHIDNLPKGAKPEVFVGENMNPNYDEMYKHGQNLGRRTDFPLALIVSGAACKGLIDGLASEGRYCPHDYSLVVTSNSPNAVFIPGIHLSMSSIMLDQVKVGQLAAKRLLSRLEVLSSETGKPFSNIVPCKITYRDSVINRKRGVLENNTR